jgi:predicted nucleic acid-binding protein
MRPIFWTLRSRRCCGDWCGNPRFSAPRADQALQDLLSLRLNRYPHFVFLPRIWRLRHNLSAYDAAYVALSERLGATLITATPVSPRLLPAA